MPYTRLLTVCSPAGDSLTTHHPGESYSLFLYQARRFFLITDPVLVSALSAHLAAKAAFKVVPWWDNTAPERSRRPPRVTLVFTGRMQTTVVFLETPPASEVATARLIFPRAHIVTPAAMKQPSPGTIPTTESA